MDDERHGGLDVRGYATLAAYLRAAAPERATDIVARHGLTRDGWQTAADRWTRAIEEEIARGGHRRLLEYADAFQAAQRRLSVEPAALEATEDIVVSPAAVATAPTETARDLTPDATGDARRPPEGAAWYGSTAPVNVKAIFAQALPFDPSAASQVVLKPPSAGAKASPLSTGTLLDMPAVAVPQASAGGEPRPPARPVHDAPRAPDLPFETYVALCAELTVSPARSEEILARARVPQSALAELHASWRARLAADAALAGRWHALYAHYRAWFEKKTP